MKKVLSILLSALILFSLTSAFAETQLIGISYDGTNQARGLKLLEAAGLIEIDPAAGYSPELKDVTRYIYDIELVPTQDNMLVQTLQDFSATTINGTYATAQGYVPSRDGLLIEKQDESGNNPYVNIIVARTADKDNETYQTIVKAYQTQLVAEYLLTAYQEAYFPSFPYDPDFTVAEGFVEEINAYESDPVGKVLVRVGVCGSNNNQWLAVQKVLDEQNAGIYIELVEFDAYNLPNEALNSGDIDLNAFQHKAYLNKDSADNGYDLTPIGDTLIAPLTLYSKKFASIDEIKDAAGLLN